MSMTIGIVGAGQLGMMLALEGYKLGYNFSFFDRHHESPAFRIGKNFLAEFEAESAERFGKQNDIITYEFENIPLSFIQELEKHSKVYPSSDSIRITQDRILEKTLFKELMIPATRWETVNSFTDFNTKLIPIGYPCILKTTRMGYDGKGQFVLHCPEDILDIDLDIFTTPLILEKFIEFDYEVSLISVRDVNGGIIHYPLTRNYHEGGILRLSYVSNRTHTLQETAEAYNKRILETLNHVGVLSVEYFVKDGVLYGNEIAPRVHNSGHWTLDSSETSQFENHIRAITSLELGSTLLKGGVGTSRKKCWTGMVNFIGAVPSVQEVLKLPYAKIHVYGKKERAGRKVGHLNITPCSSVEFKGNLKQLQPLYPLKIPKNILNAINA